MNPPGAFRPRPAPFHPWVHSSWGFLKLLRREAPPKPQDRPTLPPHEASVALGGELGRRTKILERPRKTNRGNDPPTVGSGECG